VAAANQSFYEVLGISRNAKINDINRAYARIRSEMQREDSVPNPRLAAMAKVAYETLSDPQKRAEYDATLGILGKPKAARGKRKDGPLWIGVAVVVLAIAGAAGYFVMNRHKPLERHAVPAGEVRRRRVRALQEVEQHRVRIVGRADGVVGQ